MGFISDLLINVSAFRIKIGEKLMTLSNRIGNLPSLSTTNKTSLVNAINEVKTGSVSVDPRYKRISLSGASISTVGVYKVVLGQGMSGWIKIRLTGSYSSQNSNGYIEVTGGIGANTGTLIWNNELRCITSIGQTRVVYYIDPVIKVDENGFKYIEIHKKSANNNALHLDIEFLSNGVISETTGFNPYVDTTITTSGVSQLTNEVTLFGKLDVQGSGGITTLNHGTSAQWKESYDYSVKYNKLVSTTYNSVDVISNQDFDTLPKGNYTAILSATNNTNAPTNIGNLRGLFKFGANHVNLSQDIVIGTTGMSFRNSTNNIWRKVWTDSDFNPSNYALLSQVYTQTQALGLFVGLTGVQTIAGTKTFSSSPIVPNASLNSHAVNLGQLNSAIAGVSSVFTQTAQGGIKTSIWTSNALSPYSIALGHMTSAGGLGAVSIGYGVTTLGTGSVNYGYQSTITGNFSNNLGSFNGINANKATTIGLGLLNDQEGCTVIGRFNAPTGTYDYDDDGNLGVKKIFVVGGGKDADSRKNAIEVTADLKAKFANNLFYDPTARATMVFGQTDLIDKKYFDDNIPTGGGASTYQDYTILNNLQDDYYNGEIVKGLNEVSYLELSNLRFAVKDIMTSDLLEPYINNLFGQIVVYDPNAIKNTEVIIKGNIKLNRQYAEDEKVYLNPYLCILCNGGSTSLQLVSSTGIRNLAVSTRTSTSNTFMVAQLGVIQYDDQTNEYYLFFNPQIL